MIRKSDIAMIVMAIVMFNLPINFLLCHKNYTAGNECAITTDVDFDL